jgi:hypothetical protein
MFQTDEGQRLASGCVEFGGWNHRDNTLTPIQVSALLAMPGNPALFWVVNSLAAAAEAGRLDTERYIESCLRVEDVRAFRVILRDAGQDQWLNDRHRNTLRKLRCSELDAVTY